MHIFLYFIYKVFSKNRVFLFTFSVPFPQQFKYPSSNFKKRHLCLSYLKEAKDHPSGTHQDILASQIVIHHPGSMGKTHTHTHRYFIHIKPSMVLWLLNSNYCFFFLFILNVNHNIKRFLSNRAVIHRKLLIHIIQPCTIKYFREIKCNVILWTDGVKIRKLSCQKVLGFKYKNSNTVSYFYISF